MKEKKAVLLGLLDVIEALEPSREDIAATVKEMAKRFALAPSEFFPQEEPERQSADAVKTSVSESEPVSEASVPQRKGFSKNGKRLGRPPKKASQAVSAPSAPEKEENGEKNVSAVSEKTADVRKTSPAIQSETAPLSGSLSRIRKGFSKNGKRLGRPPKNASQAILLPAASESAVGRKVSVSVEPAAVDCPVVKTQAAAVKTEPKANSSAAENDAFSGKELSFEEEVEKLKYGREYSLDALYSYKGRLIRTNRVMADALPVGIFIPHLRRCGYKEFILYYADESAGLTVNMAKSYARNRLPEYAGQRWKIKEDWYDGAVKEVLDEANVLLKKMGGDKFEGKYFSPNLSYYGQNADVNRKFRYVCDVP